MPADDNLAQSTSGLHHLPPDESAPREPVPAHVDHRAPLARLGDRIAELSARSQAATYELLVLIREFDARESWDGCLSCAQWLSWRAGLAPGAAREHVRVARALGKLPKLSDAMRRGRISYSKVRAVTRVATPENEDDLLYVCQAGTAAHVERIARAWRRIDRNVEQAEERHRHASRELRTWVDEDGMVVVRGRLTPEVGAVLRRALEAACDQARRSAAAGGAENGEADAATASAEDATDASIDAAAEREAADAAADAPEPTLGAAAGGRHRDVGGGGVGGRARPRDGRRPVSGGAARGRGGAGRTARRSRGNVRRCGVRVEAADRRPLRFRGNPRERHLRVEAADRRPLRFRGNPRGRRIRVEAADRRPLRSRGNLRGRRARLRAAGRR